VEDDKRVAIRKLEELLTVVRWHQGAQKAYRSEGDTAGVELCDGLLKLDYARIREHCAEHGLKRPYDVPSEDAE